MGMRGVGQTEHDPAVLHLLVDLCQPHRQAGHRRPVVAGPQHAMRDGDQLSRASSARTAARICRGERPSAVLRSSVVRNCAHGLSSSSGAGFAAPERLAFIGSPISGWLDIVDHDRDS
jgi:hypothetical protein